MPYEIFRNKDDVWANTADDFWLGSSLFSGQASISISFQAANLRTSIPIRLVASQASIQVSLQDAKISQFSILFASQASIQISLNDAEFTYVTIPDIWEHLDDKWVNTVDDEWFGVELLRAETGSFTITGGDVVGLTGLFTLDAECMRISIPEEYAFIQDADFQFLDDGGFLWTTDLYAKLLWHHLVKGEQAVITATGQEAILRGEQKLSAAHATVTASGQACNLLWHQLLKAEQGAVAITPYDATLFTSSVIIMPAEQQSATITFRSAGLFWHQLLRAEQGAVAITGQTALLAERKTLKPPEPVFRSRRRILGSIGTGI